MQLIIWCLRLPTGIYERGINYMQVGIQIDAFNDHSLVAIYDDSVVLIHTTHEPTAETYSVILPFNPQIAGRDVTTHTPGDGVPVPYFVLGGSCSLTNITYFIALWPIQSNRFLAEIAVRTWNLW